MTLAKRVLVGAPMRSENLGETLLPKRVALPIFSSDALSSVAYATEAILKVLTVGGLAYLYLTPWVALAGARRVLPAGDSRLSGRRRLL